jgi:hypothetical protein
MATYYLPNVGSFVDGSVGLVSGPTDCTAAIAATLDNLETDNGIIEYFEEQGHTIKVWERAVRLLILHSGERE